MSVGAITLLEKLDFYGNSQLHALAEAIDADDLWILKSLIESDISQFILQQRNTSGGTFMHVICRHGLHNNRHTRNYIEILKSLALLDFDFTVCDYFGRNILHRILFDSDSYVFDISALEEIISITNIDLGTMDCLGRSILVYLSHITLRSPTVLYSQGSGRLSVTINENAPVSCTYKDRLKANSQDNTNQWLAELLISGHLNKIDSNGDTPLSAILKEWDTEDCTPFLCDVVKYMLDRGADVHMRDRTKNTALIIAATRGFRPVLSLLLLAGGNVHSRTCGQVGVLSHLKTAMGKAQMEERGALYARQLSGHNLLVDFGAISNPIGKDEWMLPSARASLPSEHFGKRS